MDVREHLACNCHEELRRSPQDGVAKSHLASPLGLCWLTLALASAALLIHNGEHMELKSNEKAYHSHALVYRSEENTF